MNASIRFLGLDGTTVILAPTDAGGYRIQSVTMPGRTRRRSVVSADDVEGDVEQQSVLSSGIYQVQWLLSGTSGSNVESKRAELIAAAETRAYLLEVTIDSVVTTWLANAADTTSDLGADWLHLTKRPVLMSVPVQPRTVEELG